MLKILIIDDEPDLLELYTELLSNDRRKIKICSSGEKALNLLKVYKYDVVLSDKKMKEVSGLDILKAVEVKSPETVFLLITGDKSEKISFLNKKSEFILKPFSFPMLNTILTNLEQS